MDLWFIRPRKAYCNVLKGTIRYIKYKTEVEHFSGMCDSGIRSTARRRSRSWWRRAATPAFTFTSSTWASPGPYTHSHRDRHSQKISFPFRLNSRVVPVPYVGVRKTTSVCVADPDPSDPYVFGPPGSGSISQRHGSPDPDPHQNVLDPQH